MENWQIREIVLKALEEDLPFGDRTTELIISATLKGCAYFLAKSELVICGERVVETVFHEIDPEVKITWYFPEGALIAPQTKIGLAEGKVQSLLKGERVALNFLQHLSGIATKSRKMSEILGNTTFLLDTRKTLPGLKILQKYAVKIGGGQNHRFSLSDGVLIKDNHIKALGGLGKVLEKLKAQPHTLKVEIEIKTLDELKFILEKGDKVDALLLDNFSEEDLKIAVSLIRKSRPDLLIEVSGGITEENLKRYANLGINFVSSGALTHSVKAVDISFKIEKVWE